MLLRPKAESQREPHKAQQQSPQEQKILQDRPARRLQRLPEILQGKKSSEERGPKEEGDRQRERLS